MELVDKKKGVKGVKERGKGKRDKLNLDLFSSTNYSNVPNTFRQRERKLVDDR